jgi:Tfp pilus assembly protein PilX
MRAVRNNHGVALVLSLILMIMFAAMAAGYGQIVNSAQRLAGAQQKSAQALYTAEAGLNKAVWYLLNTAPDGTGDGSWRTSPYPAAAGHGANDARREDFADGHFTMWVENGGPGVLITARGEINGVARTVRQAFAATSPVTPQPAGWQEI